MNSEIKELIQKRLHQAFSPDFLEVIDESNQHIGHAGHQAGGRHFTVQIAAVSLKSLSRLEAHRRIYALFTDLMPYPIHALRILLK